MPADDSWIEANWDTPPGIRAGTTTRSGGTSSPPFDTFNLALHVGDSDAAVLANRKRLASLLDLPAEPCWLEQVHGNRISNARELAENPRADGAWTSRDGVVCVVLTADCLPLLFCDRKGQVVAAVHVGWRGLGNNIIANAIGSIDTDPRELLAWIGPYISADHYEIGKEVRDACLNVVPEATEAFIQSRTDHWYADLGLLVRTQLTATGVTDISESGYCTYSDHRRFYSYRRDGKTGRSASLIWIDHHAT